uniref:Endodeoxyribonuclease RusA n=1 Tax=Siphoviridae sp. ctoRD1 TaxID=2825669 RepID=A0A8S5QDV2_9CAUD|nr:MAG TPA: Endodeoxyribonuclease RusA [Siphoviridae sp. ctoRD1]
MSGRAIVTSPLPETKEAANEQWHLLLHRAWCREHDYDGGVRHHYLGSAFLEEMEMKWFCFMVPGKPQGKGRPRFSRKSGTAYTPSKTRDYERLIASRFYKFGGAKVAGRVVVEIIAAFPVPKSWTIQKKTDAVCGNVSPGKPDIDNIQKAVLDGLNGVAYDDDSQVVDVHCRKVYTDESGLIAGVYIRLTPVMDEWRIPEWLLVQ